MKKIALIYWPKKGNTEEAAYKIFQKFERGTIDIFTITDFNTAEFALYDAFIIGGSTTGADNWGQAHKTRWADFFAKLSKAGIQGKPFALFGLGDQVLYPYHFVDGMALMKEMFEKHGAVHKGWWPTEGYDFQESDSVENGKFCGLALDLDHQKELLQERIDAWTEQVKKELKLI
jgi:flavodoxin I